MCEINWQNMPEKQIRDFIASINMLQQNYKKHDNTRTKELKMTFLTHSHKYNRSPKPTDGNEKQRSIS